MSNTSVPSMNAADDVRSEGFEQPQRTAADAYATALEPVALDTRDHERQLIGYVLAHPSAASDEVLALPIEHMSNPAHAVLWQVAVERSYAGYAEFDAAGVMTQLRDEHPELPGLPEQAKHYAIQWGFGTVGVVASTLAEEVSKGHVARETERALMQAWQQLASGRANDAREIMTGLDPNAGTRDQWATLGEAWNAALADAGNPSAIIPTPWASLNRYFEGGLRARHVYVLAGLAGAGKTASAQDVINHAARDGRSVAVFSLEMGMEDLARRQMSTSGQLPMSEVMRPGLDMSKGSHEKATQVVDEIGERVRIDDSEDLTVAQLRARGRVAVRRHGAELIVVDYAQLVGHDNSKLNERETISEVVKEITRMSKELRVPVLLLAQPNRNASYQGRKLELTDLYGSGALEKFAAGVILLNKVMDEDGDGNKVPTEFIDFDIRKNRFGQNDVTVRMLSDLSRQKFQDMGG